MKSTLRAHKNSSVIYQKPAYVAALKLWQKIIDVCSGEDCIKDKKEVYLPKPNPNDTRYENEVRYEQYLSRAVFYNVTGRTLDGLLGFVFNKEPILKLVPDIEYLADNADGMSTPIDQQARTVVSEILKKGRHGLYVDYPYQESIPALSEENNAIIVSVKAENIINWKTQIVNNKEKLVLVVVRERIEEQLDKENPFVENKITQYRVFSAFDDTYQVTIWKEEGQGFDVTTFIPKDAKGKNWSEIPFIFVGSVNNVSNVDAPPLYDLATINLAHYRNSADYEDSCFFTGQVQSWMSGLSEGWRDHLESSGIYIGSRTPVLLPEGGNFGFAQANPNILVGEAMSVKEKQMISLGARIIKNSAAIKTATEAQSEMEQDSSVLSSLSINVSDAYTKCFSWAMLFMSSEKNDELLNSYKLSMEFADKSLDGNMLNALVSAWQAGAIPSTDLWGDLRGYGIIDDAKSDDEIKDEIEADDLNRIDKMDQEIQLQNIDNNENTKTTTE